MIQRRRNRCQDILNGICRRHGPKRGPERFDILQHLDQLRRPTEAAITATSARDAQLRIHRSGSPTSAMRHRRASHDDDICAKVSLPRRDVDEIKTSTSTAEMPDCKQPVQQLSAEKLLQAKLFKRLTPRA